MGRNFFQFSSGIRTPANDIVEYKTTDRVSAAIDPENRSSTRVVEKLGFQKGEIKRDFYERTVDGQIVKGHMQFYFLDRPVGRNQVD